MTSVTSLPLSGNGRLQYFYPVSLKEMQLEVKNLGLSCVKPCAIHRPECDYFTGSHFVSKYIQEDYYPMGYDAM
jgi:hypothetical protein